MKRDRSRALVCRNGKILLVEKKFKDIFVYDLPGGGVEKDETPEQACIRELKEETGLHGTIIRPLSIAYKADLESRTFSFLVDVDKDEEPIVGIDPEFEDGEQKINDVVWKSFNEITERDRAYLLDAGILRVPAFHSEIKSWSEKDISYPKTIDSKE